MFSQGYVGVSKNPESRWFNHSRYSNNQHLKAAIKKYGWDNLIKEVVLISEETYCYDLEAKIRPIRQIGWNIAEGGAKPPNMTGTTNTKNAMRLKGKTGNHCHNFKYYIIAKNLKTNQEKIFAGNKALTDFGFQFQNVNHCLQGKRKSHKGYTFKRLEVCQ
jgi:hypothetical protein